jgi:uncharacterized protein DUF4304
MDSKVVNKEIRRTVWPVLREAGFGHFSSRSAWRHVGSRVEVLNFQSFNTYNAGVLGCTTYSFSVNLGAFLGEVPPSHEPTRIKAIDSKPLPEEYECHLRGRLHRGFTQAECARQDIWYIDPAGQYLEKAVHDVRMTILRDGFPWYESLRDTGEVLRVLTDESEDMDRLWGFGANPSPLRFYLTGYVALALGKRELARNSLQAVLRSDSFQSVHQRIAGDIETCGLTSA